MTDNHSTFVSVLMPAYNAERHLRAALDSVLAQTHRHFELVAIDDGSTDSTDRILDEYARRDERIRVIHQANMGMGAALNAALPSCRGEWIVRIDADDVMLPNRIERQLAFVAEHPRLQVASTLVEYIDAADRVLGRNKSPFTDPAVVRQTVERGWVVGIHHPTVMARKSAMLAAGGYRSAYWPADDNDLWNRILDTHPDGVLVQGEHLVQYRIHTGSVCVSKAMLTQEKAEWMEACVPIRRAGQPEPTWEQYTNDRRNAGWWRRAHDVCRGRARVLYKQAVIDYACRRYVRFASELFGAFVLEPKFVIERVAPQLLPRRAG